MLYSPGNRSPGIAEGVYDAGNATLTGAGVLKPGASIWFNCVLHGGNGGLIVGEQPNVQGRSVVHTDPALMPIDRV